MLRFKPINRNKVNTFTATDLKWYNKFNDLKRKTTPKIFGDNIAGGLTYKTAMLIDAKDIDPDMDKLSHVQSSVRKSKNEERDAIQKSIEDDGWDFNEISIAVVENEPPCTFKYRVTEGRTRYSCGTGVLNISNFICEVYQHTDKTKDPAAFSMYMNTVGTPKGFAKDEDMLVYLSKSLKDTDVLKNKDADDFAWNLETESRRILQETNMVLTKNRIDNLVTSILEDYDVKPYSSYNSADATDFIQLCIDNHKTIPKTSILFAAGSDSEKHKSLFIALKKLLQDDPDGDSKLVPVFYKSKFELSSKKSLKKQQEDMSAYVRKYAANIDMIVKNHHRFEFDHGYVISQVPDTFKDCDTDKHIATDKLVKVFSE